MGRFTSRIMEPAALVNFSGFLDLFAVSMIMPLILPHARSLGASTTVAGIFGSTYGALQLFSSPVMGKWSDMVGRRASLIVTLGLTGCGYGIMGLSTSIFIMLLARIPGGIFKHSQNISKSYLADITSREKHSHVFGQFNAASSFGFILGPMVGGHIAEWPGGFAVVGVLACLTFFLNAATMWLFLPAVTPSEHPETSPDKSPKSLKSTSGGYSFNIKEMVRSFRAINWDNLWDLFLIKFLGGFSVILFRSSFSLMSQSEFEASPRIIGYLTSYSGAVSTLCGLFVGRLAKYYDNDGKLYFHMVVLEVVTLFSLTVSPNLVWIAVLLCPLSIVTSVMRVMATALTIHKGRDQDRGALMGFSQSIMSIARMLAPFVGGVAMEFSPRGPLLIGTCAAALSLILLILRPQGDETQKVKQS
ncbi:LOW QUALITY PROTEIN: major facilitator superfamily domain-containing protein 9-like [Haliotis rubra]|uniref:LOW QUALITY PROTEIN: major facilitator superfamily domain-containing protein 9-like n=1 Tax=Haliotis rubra TaxID=36100 RepID=UPI001EE5D9EF|nr:LOW QUALITY PROTEIN: major facilitator superfamily domain-containing protein 9-like [Haliotis rubra]